MDDLPGPQEANGVVDVRVVGEPQDVVVGKAGFLLRRQVLGQVGDDVAGDLHGGGGPGVAGGELGIYAGGVVHEVGREAGAPDLFLRQIAGQLMDDGPNHLQMAQLFGADVGKQPLQLRPGHGVPLAQIAQRGPQLAVWAAVLADDDRRQLGVAVLDVNGVLQLLLINEHQSFPPLSQGHGSFSQA